MINKQFGFVNESTYGTAVTVTRFYEPDEASFKANVARQGDVTLRAGSLAPSLAQTVPYVLGATGSVKGKVPTKGFGLMLTHMLGASSVATVSDSNYTQTHTLGSLLGRMMTAQIDRPLNPAETSQAFTMLGGKVTSWSLECSVDGSLMYEIELDGQTLSTAISLATASYPSAATAFSWIAASVSIDSSAAEVKRWKISCSNAMNTDRRYLRASALKKQPLENAHRDIDWEVDLDFVSLDMYNKLVATSATGTAISLDMTCDGPIAHGGTTLPRVTVATTSARIDDIDFDESGYEPIMQKLKGKILTPASGEPLTVTYRTTDSAV